MYLLGWTTWQVAPQVPRFRFNHDDCHSTLAQMNTCGVDSYHAIVCFAIFIPTCSVVSEV